MQFLILPLDKKYLISRKSLTILTEIKTIKNLSKTVLQLSAEMKLSLQLSFLRYFLLSHSNITCPF